LLVVAHADDEVIGAGNLLARLPEAERVRVVVAYVTDSAPTNLWFAQQAGFQTREEYAAARVAERNAALRLAGISPDQCVEFGFRDQESWRDLVEITERIAHLLERVRPAVVLTHPYEGGHPDHDAAAFAVRQAVDRSEGLRPQVIEFTSYHAGASGLETGRFLPVEGCLEEIIVLDEEARARKQAMFDCYASQARVLAWFSINEERFRPAPAYDFTKAPHAGTLHYEALNWGVTGEMWRREAAEALQLLQRSYAWD